MMHKQCLAACACFPGVQAVGIDTNLHHDNTIMEDGMVRLGALGFGERRTPCSGPYLAPRASPRGRGWCPVIVEAGCAGHSVMVL